MMTDAQAAGWRLANAREYAGLSVEQAARMLRLPRETLEAWERGDTVPDQITCRRLGHLYKVRVWEILQPGYVPPEAQLDIVCMLRRGKDRKKPLSDDDKIALQRFGQFVAESIKNKP